MLGLRAYFGAEEFSVLLNSDRPDSPGEKNVSF